MDQNTPGAPSPTTRYSPRTEGKKVVSTFRLDPQVSTVLTNLADHWGVSRNVALNMAIMTLASSTSPTANYAMASASYATSATNAVDTWSSAVTQLRSTGATPGAAVNYMQADTMARTGTSTPNPVGALSGEDDDVKEPVS